MTYSKNVAPYGWYVASYLLRFVELDQSGNDDPEKRFISWENTVLIKAQNFDEAYDKTVEIALAATEPYKGGEDGVNVQWVFEGLTDILPIYEELGDGAEIMWAEYGPRKLRNIRKRIREKSEMYQ
jgi:hypothetical protein